MASPKADKASPVAVDTALHLVEVREKMMALVTAQKAVELSLAVLDTECSLGTGKVLAMPGAVQKADKASLAAVD